MDSPADEQKAGVPFRFSLSIKTHGDTSLDADSLAIFYLRRPTVDLTDRLKPYLNGDKLRIDDATAPAGRHTLLIVAKDSMGAVSRTFIDLQVAP